VLTAIQHDLEDAAPDADDYDWPEPAEGDEDDNPLLDTTRDYIEQIDRFKEHQDKPTSRKDDARYTNTCSECGKPFEAKRFDAKTCSNKCRTDRSIRIRKEAKEKSHE
jgi:hypothetical protein